MTINFLPNSYAKDLLETVVLCGEYPWQSLDLLGKNRLMYVRTLKKIRNESFMTVSGSAEMKTIRLTKKGLTQVYEHLGEEYLDHYLNMSEGHKFRGGGKASGNTGAIQTWRHHRMAEILVVLKSLNVNVWGFQKPNIDLNLNAKKTIDPNFNIFYTSKEIKNADAEQSKKTNFTRIMGTLFCQGGIYPIYHTNKGLMKWQQQGEMKAQILVEDIVNCNYNFSFDKPFIASRSIMFGKDPMLISKILQSNGGKRMQNNFELLSFDNTYQNIHFITLDENGKKQLQILMSKNWQEKILKLLFDKSVLLDKNKTVDADAFINNTFILSFLDGDIGRLKRFKQSYKINPKNKFKIICFNWQKNAIKDYMPEAEIEVIDADLFLNSFQER